MTSSSLHEFVTKMTAKNRITFADVRRLRRDILPDGVSSRDEAELLIRLDTGVARSDVAWTDWLVGVIVDFVVWVERPTGSVEGEAAQWLMSELLGGGAPTKAGRQIAREVWREAQRVDDPMASFATEEELVPAMIEREPMTR
jgi:hypothetical protein